MICKTHEIYNYDINWVVDIIDETTLIAIGMLLGIILIKVIQTNKQ